MKSLWTVRGQIRGLSQDMSVFCPKNEPQMSHGLSYGLSENGSNSQENFKTIKSKIRSFFLIIIESLHL